MQVQKVYGSQGTIRIQFNGGKNRVVLTNFHYDKAYDTLLRDLIQIQNKDLADLTRNAPVYKSKGVGFIASTDKNAMQVAKSQSDILRTTQKKPSLEIMNERKFLETPSLVAFQAHQILTERVYGQQFPVGAIPKVQRTYGPSNKKRPWQQQMSTPSAVPKVEHYNMTMSQNTGTSWWEANKKFKDENTPLSRREGFRNSGNNCYLNATLQALLNLPQFVKSMLTVGDQIEERSLVKSLLDVLQQKKLNTVIDPAALKLCVGAADSRFKYDEQQDADEFLRSFLDQLETELGALINRLFEFEVFHKVMCANCNHESVTTEVYRDIPLFLPSGESFSIQGLVTEFFNDNMVDYNCEVCRGNKARISTIIKEPPQILILQVKRFGIDVTTQRSSKRSEPVKLSPTILLQNFAFDMKCIISHIGSTPQSGHYVCDVQQKKVWNCYDDCRLREVGNFAALQVERQRCAYLLFLERLQ